MDGRQEAARAAQGGLDHRRSLALCLLYEHRPERPLPCVWLAAAMRGYHRRKL
jgi:hypothetical protein